MIWNDKELKEKIESLERRVEELEEAQNISSPNASAMDIWTFSSWTFWGGMTHDVKRPKIGQLVYLILDHLGLDQKYESEKHLLEKRPKSPKKAK